MYQSTSLLLNVQVQFTLSVLSFPQPEKGYEAGSKVPRANERQIILHILWWIFFLKFPQLLPNCVLWQAQKRSASTLSKREMSFLVLLWHCLALCSQRELLLDQRQRRTNINSAVGGTFYHLRHGLLYIAIWLMSWHKPGSCWQTDSTSHCLLYSIKMA